MESVQWIRVLFFHRKGIDGLMQYFILKPSIGSLESNFIKKLIYKRIKSLFTLFLIKFPFLFEESWEGIFRGLRGMNGVYLKILI